MDQLPDPCSCQSRKRRQQVIPEPQPSSCGSISQGIPLRNRNTIPARHARSAKRGLPLLGFAFEVGIKGFTSSPKLFRQEFSRHEHNPPKVLKDIPGVGVEHMRKQRFC